MYSKNRFHKFVSMLFIVAIFLSSVYAPVVSAQGSDGLKRQVNAQSGKVSFIGPESGRSIPAFKALGTFLRPQDPAMALAKRFGSEFGLKDPERELFEMKSNRSDDGRVIVRYQQKYDGVPVIGGELIVDTNQNGDLYSMNGEVSPDLSLAIHPTVDSAQATQTALAAVAKWYGKTPAEFVAAEPELWIFDESLLKPSTRPAELVWRMEVTPKELGMPVRELVLVNAERGNISLHFNQIDMAWKRASTSPIEPSVDTMALSSTDSDATNNTVAFTAENMPALSGGTWYVATTGSDSNDCATTSTPCLTINGAIGKAASGDTIKVKTGTYTSTGSDVILINKSFALSGGWNTSFSSQTGLSTLDGQSTSRVVGLYSFSGVTASLDRVIIKNGNVQNGGGVYSAGNLTITNSSIQSNSASEVGGGIYNYGSLTLNNTTISNNAASNGGGIYNDGNLTVNNATVTSNTASGGSLGGGIYNSATGTASLRNSILADNTASLAGPNCIGTITSNGNNIIRSTASCTITAVSGDQFNVNPLLGTFLPTLGYQPLLTGSPAINAGNPATCLTTDQRGVARVGTCDIGAYEYTTPGSAASLMVFSGSGQHASPLSAFSNLLRVVALDSQGSPVPNVNVTFTAPASGASGTFATSGTNSTTLLTDVNGIAITSIFTANNQLGAYVVTASASGAGSVNFDLMNATWDWYVSPSGNDGNSCLVPAAPCLTINGAIAKATQGEEIFVAVGTYTGTGMEVVLLNKSATLSGGWDSNFTVQNDISTIDGQSGRRGVVVNSGVTATIDHFTIQNGRTTNNAGGGIYNSGTLNISFTTIKQNIASSYGGGVFNGGSFTITEF